MIVFYPIKQVFIKQTSCSEANPGSDIIVSSIRLLRGLIVTPGIVLNFRRSASMISAQPEIPGVPVQDSQQLEFLREHVQNLCGVHSTRYVSF